MTRWRDHGRRLGHVRHRTEVPAVHAGDTGTVVTLLTSYIGSSRGKDGGPSAAAVELFGQVADQSRTSAVVGDCPEHLVQPRRPLVLPSSA